MTASDRVKTLQKNLLTEPRGGDALERSLRSLRNPDEYRRFRATYTPSDYLAGSPRRQIEATSGPPTWSQTDGFQSDGNISLHAAVNAQFPDTLGVRYSMIDGWIHVADYWAPPVDGAITFSADISVAGSSLAHGVLGPDEAFRSTLDVRLRAVNMTSPDLGQGVARFAPEKFDIPVPPGSIVRTGLERQTIPATVQARANDIIAVFVTAQLFVGCVCADPAASLRSVYLAWGSSEGVQVHSVRAEYPIF